MDLVSVVMSVYNEKEEWLSESIDSIRNQTYSNIEIIIVNDNPENPILANFLKKICQQDDRIKLIENPNNIGLVMSLNKAIKVSNGKYIARMDADDISKKNRIELQLQYLVEKELDFVFTNVDLINEQSELISLGNTRRIKSKEINEISVYGNVSKHPTWFLKKEIYLNNECYRNIPFIEDYDFFLRSIVTGVNIERMPYSLLLYRYRENSISRENALSQFKLNTEIRKIYKLKKLNDNFYVEKRTNEIINSIKDADNRKYYKWLKKRDAGVNHLKNGRKIYGLYLMAYSSLRNKDVFRNTINILRFRLQVKKQIRRS